MPHARLLLASVLLSATLGLHAETAQKPGLWDVTVKINLGAGAPQIPPEAMAKMKEMGMELPFEQPVTSQTCITPEQAAKRSLPEINDANSGCKMVNNQRKGDTMSGDMVCDGDMKGRGSMSVSLANAETFTGKSSFKGTTQGRPIDMTTDFSGKWKGADCGSVKSM